MGIRGEENGGHERVDSTVARGNEQRGRPGPDEARFPQSFGIQQRPVPRGAQGRRGGRGHRCIQKLRRQDALMEKKAWEFAQSQMKQVGMYAFMMYMSGGSVHIFSIMMTFNGLYQPLMAILNSGKAFEKFRGAEGRVSTLGPQALFCLIQCGGLGFALYKLANIGLLPTHISDWVSGVQVPVASEYSARG